MTIRVLLADDHSVLRDGLEALLQAQDGITVVAQARDGREAARQAADVKPDVAIMDIAMPALDGIDATRLIRQRSPLTQVVILSMHSASEYVFRALESGAKGYLLKESAGDELVTAIRSVHAGHPYLSQKITETVIENYLRPHQPTEPLGKLSSRERQILQRIAAGESTANIARALFLSPKTVHTYRSRLMQKLGIDCFAGLVKFAIACGLAAP